MNKILNISNEENEKEKKKRTNGRRILRTFLNFFLPWYLRYSAHILNL